MNDKNLKLTGLMLAGVIIIVSFAYGINVQPVVIGYDGFVWPDSELKTFSSYSGFTEFLRENSGQIYFSQPVWSSAMVRSDFESMDASATVKNGGTIVDYSQTNVQVTGVDEPDIVKTDGEYLYIVSNNKIYIVKAAPAKNATIECEITLEDSLSINNIFISGTRLVVFAQDYNYPIYEETIDPIVISEDVGVVKTIVPERWYVSPDTHIIIYNLDDLNDPEITKDVVVPGNFAAARMIGDFVYLITTQCSYNLYNYDEGDIIVPQIMVDGEAQEVTLTNIQYVDIPEKSRTITNIVSVNVHDDSEDVTAKIYLLGSSQVLFVSHDNIYVTYSVRNYDYDMLWEAIEEIISPHLPESMIEEIHTVRNLVNLNEYQKKTVTEWILQNFTNSISEELRTELYIEINKRFERTTIHRIEIDEGEIEYRSQGSIPGYVSNQFSLSEYDGHLRVSSTLQGWSISGFFSSRTQTLNNVYVLDMDLDIVGAVEGLAPGERIYATRFIGDKCYLVTFRQIDPFFVIDLSDPTDPTVLGELKIPGYSTYLHPYDDSHVIGIGMNGSKVKISLFDVTDMSNPIELSKYEITQNDDWGWSNSYALNEHKAFLFDKEKNLLIIPAGSYYKQSAYVFDVTLEDGIELKGKITHDEDEQGNEEDYYYWYDYGYSIKRTLYIEDTLFTFSDKMVKINSLDDLSELNSIELN